MTIVNYTEGAMIDTTKDYSTAEAAQVAGVSRQYIVKVLDLGRLKGHKVGRSWVIRGRDLQAWLETRKG